MYLPARAQGYRQRGGYSLAREYASGNGFISQGGFSLVPPVNAFERVNPHLALDYRHKGKLIHTERDVRPTETLGDTVSVTQLVLTVNLHRNAVLRKLKGLPTYRGLGGHERYDTRQALAALGIR